MIQKCPVCEGRMTVPEGFYEGKPLDADGPREKCRACEGRGTVGFPDIAMPTYPIYPTYPTGPYVQPWCPPLGPTWIATSGTAAPANLWQTGQNIC